MSIVTDILESGMYKRFDVLRLENLEIKFDSPLIQQIRLEENSPYKQKLEDIEQKYLTEHHTYNEPLWMLKNELLLTDCIELVEQVILDFLQTKIYDRFDTLEVAIKSNFKVGDIVKISDICKTIGLLDYNKGGYQQSRCKKIIFQYLRLEPTEKRKYKIVEIYPIPLLVELDLRGKKSDYAAVTTPLMIRFLEKNSKDEYIGTLNELAGFIGISFNEKKAIRISKQITDNEKHQNLIIRELRQKIIEKQEYIISSLLDYLDKEISVITFKEIYLIKNSNNEYKEANENEVEAIQDARNEALVKMGYKNISTVFRYRKEEKYFSIVYDILQKEKQLDIVFFQRKYKITPIKAALIRTLENQYKLTPEDIKNNYEILIKNFVERCIESVFKKVDDTNYDAKYLNNLPVKDKFEWLVRNHKISDDIIESVESGIFTYDEIVKECFKERFLFYADFKNEIKQLITALYLDDEKTRQHYTLLI